MKKVCIEWCFYNNPLAKINYSAPSGVPAAEDGGQSTYARGLMNKQEVISEGTQYLACNKFHTVR